MEMAFVPDVLGPIISASRAIAEERGIKFETVGAGDGADLPGVCVCPRSLQEAVVNVLDNAIKYVTLGGSGRGGIGEGRAPNPDPRIRITVRPNPDPLRPGVTVLVEDSGPGIPVPEREAVFLRGYRGDAARLVPGSGLGLAIGRSMISRMGGILDVVEVIVILETG